MGVVWAPNNCIGLLEANSNEIMCQTTRPYFMVG